MVPIVVGRGRDRGGTTTLKPAHTAKNGGDSVGTGPPTQCPAVGVEPHYGQRAKDRLIPTFGRGIPPHIPGLRPKGHRGK